MKKLLHFYGLPLAMAVLIGLSNCSYQQGGHGRLPLENSESQVKTGADAFAYSGSSVKCSIHLEK